MAIELIKISEFPQVSEPGDWIVVSDAAGTGYKISKEDFKEWLGTVTVITDKPIALADPAPTMDGVYLPTEPGTYTNAGGLVYDPDVVDAGKYVQFIKNDTVWTKLAVDLPQAENKIQEWDPEETEPYVQGDQRIWNGQIWSVDVASTTEEPGVGTDWVGKIDKISKEDIVVKRISNQVFDKTKYRPNSSILSNGVISPTEGDETTLDIDIDPGETHLAISGMHSGFNHRVVFLNSEGVIITPLPAQFADSTWIGDIPENARKFRVWYQNRGDSKKSTKNTLMINFGEDILPYEEYKIAVYSIDGNLLPAPDPVDLSSLRRYSIEITETDIYVRIKNFKSGKDLVYTIYKTSLNNIPVIGAVKLLNTGDDNTSLGTQISAGGDNTPPIQFDYLSNLGGTAHGVFLIHVVSTLHGKTSSDLLSTWASGENEYSLVEIKDADTLVFLGKPYPVSGDISYIRTLPSQTATLTHVSGAVNTSNIISQSYTSVESRPSLFNISQSFTLDNKNISEIGKYYGDVFAVNVNYDIIDPTTIVPANPFIITNGESLARVSMTYGFRGSNAMLVEWGINPLRDHKVRNVGFIQVQKMLIGASVGANKLYWFIPNVKPKTVGSNTYNFSEIADMTVNIPSAITLLPSDMVDPLKPSNRLVEILANNDIATKVNAHAHGYNIMRGSAKPAERIANNDEVWYISTPNKSYPRVVSGKFWGSEYIYGTAYFTFFDPQKNPDFTSCYYIPDGNGWLLYIDAHKTMSNRVVLLPDELSGLEISIIEQHGDIEVNNLDYVTGQGLSVNVVNYGSLVLRLF